MKTKILDFIKTANNVLFFVCLVFLMCFVGWETIDNIFLKDRRIHDSIPIVDSSEETAAPIEYVKGFIGKYEDVYIYKVRTNRLTNSDSDSGEIQHFAMVNHFSGYDINDDYETVNFLFAKENSDPNLLLESHALVVNYDLIDLDPEPQLYSRNFKISKHLFSVVLKDDNKDNVLDKTDQIVLMASELDGSNLITIATNIMDYEIVDDNELLIRQGSKNKNMNVIYNLNSGSAKVLNTDIPSS